MKKILFLLSVTALLFVSCESQNDMYKFVKTYTIHSDQWELEGGRDQLNSFYQAEIRIPELNRDIYEDGNVFCYMYQIVDGVKVQTLLPFNLPLGQGNPNGSEHLWTETYAYDFTIGSIMLYVNRSDFYTNNRPPTTSFRVVLNH